MNKLVLIGAADSIGVPYTKDNHNHQGFFEMISEHLSLKNEVIQINCFHMSTNNDNHYITKILTSPISLKDIKTSQNKMLKKCKYSGLYPYLEIPKNFLDYYKINKNDDKIIIKETIKKHKTIFIYSAFINDLLKSKNLSLFKLLKPGRIKKELEEINIEFIFKKIEKNITTLITINPNIEIYIIGLFIPTKIPYIRKNTQNFIKQINTYLNNLSIQYKNVFFVNNENLLPEDFNNIDFHPNKNGHRKIYHNFIASYKQR